MIGKPKPTDNVQDSQSKGTIQKEVSIVTFSTPKIHNGENNTENT